LRGSVLELRVGRNVLIIGEPRAFSRVPKIPHNKAAIEHDLRRLVVHPHEMHSLRAFLSFRGDSGALHGLSDHRILDLVERKIASRELGALSLPDMRHSQHRFVAQAKAVAIPSVAPPAAKPAPGAMGPGISGMAPRLPVPGQPAGLSPAAIQQMSFGDRIMEVFRRVAQKPGMAALKADLEAMIASENLRKTIAFMTGFFALGAVAQLAPPAWGADLVILGIALSFTLLAGVDAVKDLYECFKITAKARSDADLDAATALLVGVLLALGIAGLSAVLGGIAARFGAARGTMQPTKTQIPSAAEAERIMASKVVPREVPEALPELVAAREAAPMAEASGPTAPSSTAVEETGASQAEGLDWSRPSPRTGGDAAEHVIDNHGSLSLTKPNQGVFYGDPIAATEDAWSIARTSSLDPVTVGSRDIYVIPRPNSGYAGGMGGQLGNLDNITLITEQGTNRVVTAFPSGGTPPLPGGYNFLLGQ
jgi:hypothetical protein